jgi:hypothetical protein
MGLVEIPAIASPKKEKGPYAKTPAEPVKPKSDSGGGKPEARSSSQSEERRSERIRYRLIEPGGGTKLNILPSDR